MNILFFLDTPEMGGGENWIVDTAAKLRERGHGAFIACLSGSWAAKQAEKRAIPYFDYLPEREFVGHLHWQLVACLIENQIDRVCYGIPGNLPAIPLLDEAIQEAGRGGILLRSGVSWDLVDLSPQQVGLGFETVCGIITVSESVKDGLLEAIPELPPEQVHVVYNGVDLDRFSPSRIQETPAQIKATLGIPDKHLVVGAIGRLDRVKHLNLLIEAASSILQDAPNTTFLIAGDGPEKQALREAAHKAGIAQRVIFPGTVQQVNRLLHGMDILAHPSLSEGLPNVVLEAMAMQKPVVATAVGGVPELIADGKDGILIPANHIHALTEALSGLLKNPLQRSTIGLAARQKAETAFDRWQKLEDFLSCCQNQTVAIQPAEPSPPGKLYDLPDIFFGRPCAHRGA